MSKLEAIIKGKGPKQMGRITVLDAAFEEDDSADGLEFMAALQGETRGLREEEVVRGAVVEIRGKDVIVDIGYKGSGTVNLDEFNNPDGTQGVQVGDVVEVLLEMLEDANGNVRLSRERAEKMKIWDEVEKAFRSNMTVHGTVLEKVKGGLAVDIGIRAFLPGSQVDMKPVRNLDPYLGKSFDMKVIKVNRRRGNIVLSRKLFLETINASLKEETLAGLEEGKLVEGAIKNITEYGAFVDLGGVDGLLHITDMSWGRLNHPSEMFQVGDKVEVAVLKYDKETERVSLGYKQKFPDPWLSVEERYPIQATVKGKVVSITDYGAFVELEPGIEGLVHVSEMSWTKKVKSAKGMVNLGDQVEALILQVDSENRRISLGMKQITPNPWMAIAEKYQPGMIVTGTVRNITEFGAFVELEEGIDGMIHVSDMSWTRKINHPSEVLQKGQQVDAVVLEVNPADQRISLGLKQASDDPWNTITSRYGIGQIVKGKVSKIASFGAFVELEDGVDGLVHISQISDQHVEKVKDALKVGQDVEARIVKIDREERRIGLSIKAVTMNENQIAELTRDLNITDLKPGEHLVGLAAAFDDAFAQSEEWRPGGE